MISGYFPILQKRSNIFCTGYIFVCPGFFALAAQPERVDFVTFRYCASNPSRSDSISLERTTIKETGFFTSSVNYSASFREKPGF